MNRSERKEQILLDLVQQYIETAEPISSGDLLRSYSYPCSSATIRNIMVELDEAGFLHQPYTSSGRVPTPKAYRFFVDKVALGARQIPQEVPSKKISTTILPREIKRELRNAMHEAPYEAAHLLSQVLSELTNTMAFAGIIGVNYFYHEGLRHLLDEPEFLHVENIRELLDYTDTLSSRLEKLHKALNDDIQVYIGAEENYQRVLPFSLLVFGSEFPGHEQGIFGLIGPMRMRYADNIALLNEVREVFEE